MQARPQPSRPHQKDEQEVVRGAPLEQLLNRVQNLQGGTLWCSGVVSCLYEAPQQHLGSASLPAAATVLLLQLHMHTHNHSLQGEPGSQPAEACKPSSHLLVFCRLLVREQLLQQRSQAVRRRLRRLTPIKTRCAAQRSMRPNRERGGRGRQQGCQCLGIRWVGDANGHGC